MRPIVVPALIVLALASTGCKRQLKLEGKATGIKAGTSDTVIVHLKSERNATITCGEDGHKCSLQSVPYSGEMDLEVQVLDWKKPILILGQNGKYKTNQITVDVSTVPPTLSVNEYGTITCSPRDCSGVGIELFPRAEIDLKTTPGTIVEVGSDKLTVPPDGHLDAPLNVAFSPPIDKQPLANICIGFVTGSTKPPPLATTTLTLTFPDKVKATTSFTITAENAQKRLSMLLKDISKGPITFPWEKAGQRAPGKRAAIYVDGDRCYDAGTPGAVLADLDVVALSEDKTRTSECTYSLTSTKTGLDHGEATGKITMYDSHATVYDRVTGKKLGAKAFLAPKNCTQEITTLNKQIADQHSYANEDQIAIWAATFAR